MKANVDKLKKKYDEMEAMQSAIATGKTRPVTEVSIIGNTLQPLKLKSVLHAPT